MLNIQFTDSTETTICSYFACEQDPSMYTNLGEVQTSDARWAAFYKAAATSAEGLPLPTSN